MIKYILNKLKNNRMFFYLYFRYKKRKILYLDEEQKKKICNSIPLSLNKEQRNEKIIVSLTTFPARINEVYFTIFSMLNQTCRPDKIILWLTYEEFSQKNKSLPQNLLDLIIYGLEIKWCHNVGSYNKLLPTLKLYPNDIIVTIDDDIYYQEDLIEKLYREYKISDKKSIICHRAHRVKLNNKKKILPYSEWDKCIKGKDVSYNNLLTGVGGVMYPPRVLYKDVDNINLIKKICPTADDLWFWGMAILNNTKVIVVENNISELRYVNLENQLRGINTLESINVVNNKNDAQLKNLIKCYPKIIEIINKKE